MALPSRSATRTRRRFTLRALGLGLALALPAGLGPSAALAAPGWEPRPPLPVAQQEVGSAAAGGSLYVAGGFNGIGLITDDHWRFDLSTGAWTELTELPDPVHHLHAVTLRGRIHYLGGETGLNFVPNGRHYIYDPEESSFAYGAELPAGRVRGAAAVAKHRGRIYLVGGVGAGGATGMLDVFTPRTQSWRALPDMPTSREHLGAAFVGDRLYVVGGRAEGELVGETEVYDVSKRRWLRGYPQIPTPRGGLAVASIGRYVYAIGGEGGGYAHAEVERLNTRARRWVTQPPMPTPRHGLEAAKLRGGLWLAGGATEQGFGPSAASEVFFP